MNEIDRIANRVTLAAGLGALGGSISAMYKGHMIPRSASLAAFSCAMTATACFCSERGANYVVGSFFFRDLQNTNRNVPSFQHIVASHAAGGIVGGGLTGALYIGKPLRGVFFITPLMILIGIVEFKYQEVKEKNIPQLESQDGLVVDSKNK